MVRAPHGDPVADAEVTVSGEAASVHARSSKTGEFTVPDLPPGPAHVHVRAAGFAPADREVVTGSGSSRQVALGMIELAEEGVVAGTVVDGRGDPVPGARVAKDQVPTYLAVGPTPSGIAVADARGRFRLGELPAGAMTLEAYAPDVGRATVTGVQVNSGRPTNGVTIQLKKESDGHGHEPAAAGGVAVTLAESQGEGREVTLADVARGSEAERAGLTRGDVLLRVDGSPVQSMADARSRLSGPIGDDVVIEFRRGEAADSVRVAREPVRK